MPAWRFAQAQHTAQAAGWTGFVSMQNRYNLVNREEEREMIPLCLDRGIGVLPYSPLARGLLAGTRERSGARHTTRARGDSEHRPAWTSTWPTGVVRAGIAAERGPPPARVALAWLLGRPGVTAPLIGATRLPHLDDALAALEVRLTGEETARPSRRPTSPGWSPATPERACRRGLSRLGRPAQRRPVQRRPVQSRPARGGPPEAARQRRPARGGPRQGGPFRGGPPPRSGAGSAASARLAAE